MSFSFIPSPFFSIFQSKADDPAPALELPTRHNVRDADRVPNQSSPVRQPGLGLSSPCRHGRQGRGHGWRSPALAPTRACTLILGAMTLSA